MLCVWTGIRGLSQGRKEFEVQELNRYVYADEMKELARDFEQGIISQKQYEEGREELQRRALEEITEHESVGVVTAGGEKFLWCLIALIPFASISLYLTIGNPSLLGHHQESFSHWNEKGEFFLDSKLSVKEENLTQYLKESPKDIRGWLTLARILNEKGQNKDALEAYDRAFMLSSKLANDPDIVLERALIMLDSTEPDRYQEAKKELSKVIKLNPEAVRAYEILGILSFNEQKYNDAAKYWTEALNFYPESSPAREHLLDLISEAKNRASLELLR